VGVAVKREVAVGVIVAVGVGVDGIGEATT
jgi:hypothetical protein